MNLLRRLGMDGATRSMFHLLFMACPERSCAQCIALWSTVLPYDSNVRFQIRFTDCTNREFETYWEFCFIGSERLDWVEERACSRFVTEVNSIILGHILYTYIYICCDRVLYDFVFRQYSTHLAMFIQLFHCIFCTVHAIKYNNIFQHFNNYRCLYRHVHVYDTVWTCVFLITCYFLLQDVNGHV